MGMAFFVDYGSQPKQQGDFITLLLPSGSETIQLVMARGAAREMAEIMQHFLNRLDSEIQTADIVRLDPVEEKHTRMIVNEHKGNPREKKRRRLSDLIIT